MLKLARVAALGSALVGCAKPGVYGVQDQGQALARSVAAKPAPGDRIFVHILREPLLSDTVTVDERGDAAFPKLGTLGVGAMTVGQLSDTLKRRYSEYLRTPELEVVVLRRVIVHGEVAKPNVYLVPVSSTVADAIATAGGFTEAAKRNSIHLIRAGKRSAIPTWDQGLAGSTALLSGDELIVGRRNWLSLNILPAVSTIALIASVAIAARR